MAYSDRLLYHGNDRCLVSEFSRDPVTGKVVFSDPTYITGLVSLDALAVEGEDTNIFADNQIHATLAAAESYTTTMTVLQMSDEFLLKFMGWVEEPSSAITKSGVKKSGAMQWRVLLDNATTAKQMAQWNVLYNVRFGDFEQTSTTDSSGEDNHIELTVPVTASVNPDVYSTSGKAVARLMITVPLGSEVDLYCQEHILTPDYVQTAPELRIDQSVVSVEVGSSVTIPYKIIPTTVDQDLTATVGDIEKASATVANNIITITGSEAGTTTVTVKSDGDTVTATIQVTVTE